MGKYFSVACILLLTACQQKQRFATISYTKEANFGAAKVHDTIHTVFSIKNTSEENLLIKQIKTSCGCTVAKPKDSIIEKGKSTVIEVQFIADAENLGDISKSIVIDANTNPNFTVMYLKGTVSK